MQERGGLHGCVEQVSNNSQPTCTNDLSLLTLVIFQARVMSAFSLMLLSLQA
jgi:hypothetical protein